MVQIARNLLKKLRHRLCVFFNHEAVSSMSYPFCRAGSLDKHAGKAAGCSFPDHNAVGIIGGREKKQVRPGVPGTKLLSVVDRACKNNFRLNAIFSDEVLHFLGIGAATDKDHTEINSALIKLFHGIHDYRQSFIFHKSSHKKKQRNSHRYVIGSIQLFYRVLRGSSLRKVHAVWHHAQLPFIAERSKVFTCSFRDNPYIIAGLYIADHGFDSLFFKDSLSDSPRNIHVKLSVVGKDYRGPGLFSQYPCHYG